MNDKLEYKIITDYKYKGRVIGVVDADTVDACLDLGFGITMEQRFRIDNFDAPETWRPKSDSEAKHGELATKRAKQLLLDVDLLFCTSKSAGIYGRYGAQIFLPDGQDFAEVMIQEGFQKLDDYS